MEDWIVSTSMRFIDTYIECLLLGEGDIPAPNLEEFSKKEQLVIGDRQVINELLTLLSRLTVTSVEDVKLEIERYFNNKITE